MSNVNELVARLRKWEAQWSTSGEAADQIEADQKRIAELVEALKFYADGCHFALHDPDAWDTVSGEPANFYEDEACTATVEDGSVAKMALGGTPLMDNEEADSRAIAAAEAMKEAAAKVPRVYAMRLADGPFGKRDEEAAMHICNASTNMGEMIRALSCADVIGSVK